MGVGVGYLAGGGVWFLPIGSVSGASVCGGVRGWAGGGVWFHLGAPFSVGVEVCEGCCVCDMLLGVLLSCIVGWGVIVGLTGVLFVVLKARGE